MSQETVKDDILEKDNNPDPRFTATPDELKKKGIEDFQLDYAIKTLKRLSTIKGGGTATIASRSR